MCAASCQVVFRDSEEAEDIFVREVSPMLVGVSDDKEFASWMGLVPSVHQSGERIRMGGVSGPGNKRLRWALVECAQAAVRFDSRFSDLYERVSRRRGSGCAIVAVAHEMARIMYFMLSRGEPYRGGEQGIDGEKT